MTDFFSFEKLIVWQKARLLVSTTYQLLGQFPKEESYALCDQLRRAVVSVTSNIAEGMGRLSEKEQSHFIEIAYGSLMEVYSQLVVANDLGYINSTQLLSQKGLIEEIGKMLSSLKTKRTNPGI